MKKLMLFLIILMVGLSFTSNAQVVSKRIDKYENKINWSVMPSSLVYIQKSMSTTDTTENWDTYYVCFYTRDSYISLSGKDAIILFEDDTKMEISGDMDIKYYKPGIYEYSISNFGKELLEKMATTKIKGYKIHIFEQNVPSSQRDLIQNAAKKILVAKK